MSGKAALPVRRDQAERIPALRAPGVAHLAALEAQGPLVKNIETVTELDDFNRVRFDVKHDPPITKYETSTLSLEPSENGGSRVKWEMDYQMAGGYLGHFADQILLGSVHGGRISEGLANLKRYAETGETPVTL